MKRTLTVNLSSMVYTIDEDGYNLLQSYLNDIAKHLDKDECNEILKDIESRIGELFGEKLSSNKNVIELEDVQNVINVLGTPDQFTDAREEETGNETKAKTSKRFYRDVDHGMIGGIASGLSVYANVDVILIRILMIFFVFVGFGTLIPVYLLIWLITPAAISVSQKYEMYGEPISLKKIKVEFQNAQKYVSSDNFKRQSNEIGERLGSLFGWVAKFIVVFIGGIFALVGVCIVVSLTIVFVQLMVNPYIMDQWHYPFEIIATLSTLQLGLLFSALLMFFAIPLVSVIYSIYQVLNPNLTRPRSHGWLAFSLWLISLIMMTLIILQAWL